MTMNDEETKNSGKATPPARGLRRWLRRIAIAMAIPIGIYLVFRLIYLVWISACLPADAPHIAFSLDNTLLSRVGITDVTYQRVMTATGGRLITMRPDAAGDPDVNLEAVKVLLEEEQLDGVQK